MSTKVSYRVMAIFMAFLMFSSSMAFSMEMHFCGDELKNYSVFGEAEVCEMAKAKLVNTKHSCCEAQVAERENQDKYEIKEGSCCHTSTLTVDRNNSTEPIGLSFDLSQQIIFLASFVCSNFYLFELTDEKIDYLSYHPPNIIKDLHVHLQVFRI